MTEITQIRGRDVLRGLVRAAPRTPQAMRGLWKLATARGDKQESIGSLIAHWARQRPDHPAVIFSGRRWSYRDFNTTANRWAGVLRRAGIRKGDSVAVLFENRAELLQAVAATVKLGGIAGLLNHNQRGEVLSHSLKLIQAKVLVIGEECMETFQSIADELPEALKQQIYWVPESAGTQVPPGMQDLTVAAEGELETDPLETNTVFHRDPCFYIFTSGTTGMPKAAIMSHGRWIKAAVGLGMASVGMSGDDIFYCPLPFYHNNALTVSWGSVLTTGATFAIGRKFSASRFWDEIRAVDATVFCYIGELLRYLLAQPPSPLDRAHRIRACIGNGLRPELWKPFRERYGIGHINEFYGASEGNLGFSNGLDMEGSCGYCPMPFAIVEFDTDADAPLRDARGHMRKVGKGGVGLLIGEVTERTPFDGYTNKSESEKKLFRNVFKQGDCYFNSGDLVRDLGFRHIQFVDRVGDTFRWKGENVATTEVERAFDGFAAIAEAVVYGVQVPGTDGRAGMAALTLNNENEKLNGEALAAHLRARLPAYAVPLFLRIRHAHEVTGTFKARKGELKQEGFRATSEPAYVLLPDGKGYVPLTDATRQQIERGEIRL